MMRHNFHRNHIRYSLHYLINKAGDCRARGCTCHDTEATIMRALSGTHTGLRYVTVGTSRYRIQFYPDYPALVWRTV